MKKFLPMFVVAAVLNAAVFFLLRIDPAWAHVDTGNMPTFVNGQTLTAQQLNMAFAHVHNTFSNGITDAHIATNAAIQHSKLQQPALVAKAAGRTTGTCSAGTCTLNATNITSVTFVSAGLYNVTLSYTPAATDFAVIPGANTTDVDCYAHTFATTSPHFKVQCRKATVATNSDFSVIVLDP